MHCLSDSFVIVIVIVIATVNHLLLARVSACTLKVKHLCC